MIVIVGQPVKPWGFLAVTCKKFQAPLKKFQKNNLCTLYRQKSCLQKVQALDSGRVAFLVDGFHTVFYFIPHVGRKYPYCTLSFLLEFGIPGEYGPTKCQKEAEHCSQEQ